MIAVDHLADLIAQGIADECARLPRSAPARLCAPAADTCAWCGAPARSGLCWPCRENERGER